MRWTSRDVLLRVAVVGALAVLYYMPQRFLQASGASTAARTSAAALERDVAELRLWLTFAVTALALLGVISTQLLLVSCIHAALHLVQAMAGTPARRLALDEVGAHGPSEWCWRENGADTCVYEYGSVLTFWLMLRYVVLPPTSSLASWRRHSHQLRKFFTQHDRQYVALVDRLLEDYTGNERLLFARIRKIYRPRMASTPLKTP